METFPLLPIVAHFTTSKQVFMLKLWVLGAAQLYFSCRAGVLTSLPRWTLTCLASQSVNTRVIYRKCTMLTREVLRPEYTEYRFHRICKVLTPTLLLLTPAPQLPIPGRVFPCLHHRLACTMVACTMVACTIDLLACLHQRGFLLEVQSQHVVREIQTFLKYHHD